MDGCFPTALCYGLHLWNQGRSYGVEDKKAQQGTFCPGTPLLLQILLNTHNTDNLDIR